MLRKHFGVTRLRDQAVHDHAGRALEYRPRMEAALGGKRRASLGAMYEIAAQVDRWLHGICLLARRLDRFQAAGSYSELQCPL